MNNLAVSIYFMNPIESAESDDLFLQALNISDNLDLDIMS